MGIKKMAWKAGVRSGACLLALFGLWGCAHIQVSSSPDVPVPVKALDPNQERSDLGNAEDLLTVLRVRDRRFNDADFHVASRDGYLLFYGRVEDDRMMAFIEEEAARLPKVSRYFNVTTIGTPRTALQRLSDNDLGLKVNAVLRRSGMDPNIINIAVFDRTVYLLGVVSKPQGDFSKDLVRNIEGVQKVVTLFHYAEAPTFTPKVAPGELLH